VRPLHFLLILGGLLAAVFAVQRPAPERDLFSTIPAGQSVRFTQMTEPELYAAKLAHGLAAPRRAIGLFGNSRAVMVGAADLGSPPGGFFNFAVPGSSFRTSVALAEDLARAGKLPKTVLISLDHLEIQFDGNPNTRQITAWLGRVRRDLAAGFARPDISFRDTLRAAWRHLYVGYGGVTRYLNIEQLALGIGWRFADTGVRRWWHGLPRAGAVGYRRDGSRALGDPAKHRPLTAVQPAAPAVLAAYLRDDLRRLAALRRQGARIIIYESPLEAASYERSTRHPAPYAAALRAMVLRDCMRLGLEFHGQARSAARAEVAGADGWHDATHPPAKALAAFLLGLIARGPDIGAAGERRAAPTR
jgi:hypothetical protein